MDSIQYEVIGVVEDFHSYSFARPVRPTIFTVAEKQDYRYFSMEVRSGSENKTYKTMQAKWAELFPETPFEGGHQEDVWGGYFEAIEIHGIVWNVFAFIAIALASLGLYGLITLNVAGRVREFSIRKVLGAGLKNIAANIANQYIVLFAVALTIGAPVSYLLTKLLIESAYAYHMPITFSSVVTGVVVLIFVLLATVSTQVGKVAKSTPVEGLKME
jgi:ABC-type antimicrobial peptide transport system permease subunit